MERKSVILVYWKKKATYESYSSLESFISHHPQYTRGMFYAGRVDGVFTDTVLELRRIVFWHNRFKRRRGGLPRWKSGPAKPNAMRARPRKR